MSLGIEASATCHNINYPQVIKICTPIAQRLKLAMTVNDEDRTLKLILTDNGYITMSWTSDGDNGQISLQSQTSIMGPGFHKLVVDFIDFFSDLSGVEFDVSDETGYFANRDFKKLREEHFEPWLAKVATILLEHKGASNNFLLNWDLAWPKPEDVPSTVCTPFGRLTMDMLARTLEENGIAALTDKFFPCPHESIDQQRVMWFDMIYQLWIRCYFMPSGRSAEDREVNSKIISYINKLIDSGTRLPIPHREYLELCSLNDCRPLDLEHVPDLQSQYPIGFRKGPVRYSIGEISYTLPGSFLLFEEKNSWGYWNGTEADITVRIAAYSTNSTSQNFIAKDESIIERGQIEGGIYIIADLGIDNGARIIQIQLISYRQFTVFTISIPNGSDGNIIQQKTKKFISGITVSAKEMIDTITKLHDEDRHEEIIEILSKQPAELTDELKGLLARAYNNIDDYGNALKLLMQIKDSNENNPLWHYRVGYACYYTNNYTEATEHFNRALELDPDDGDAKWFIAQCQLANPFAERVEKFWKWITEHAGEIEKLISKNNSCENEIIQYMQDGMSIIGPDIFYNIGGRNELTFCVEGRTECLFLYKYIVDMMPEPLREKWTVNPCKLPAPDPIFNFKMYDRIIDTSEIMVSTEYDKETDTFNLRYYHPGFTGLTDAESSDAFYTVLELVIGEGPVYNYINEVYPDSDSSGMFHLTELPKALKFIREENGKEYTLNPELNFCVYSCEPAEGENRLRFDVICGNTLYLSLNREFTDGERKIFDRFTSKGVEPLMLIMSQPENMTANEFLEFRYKVESRLQELFDKSLIKGRILGGAYGAMGTAYIDLLLYDGQQFLSFISDEAVIDSLLSLDDGTVCKTNVLFKDFTFDSPVNRLR